MEIFDPVANFLILRKLQVDNPGAVLKEHFVERLRLRGNRLRGYICESEEKIN